MPRYRWNGETLVEVTGEDTRAPAVQIMRDLPAYKSPLGDGWIDGRAARREHFKRTGTREVDPSEFKATYRNPHFAQKRGLPLGEK
jgi:hypothetical protein